MDEKAQSDGKPSFGLFCLDFDLFACPMSLLTWRRIVLYYISQ